MYYHSQPTQSPPVKKYPTATTERNPAPKQHSSESAKSNTTNNIHLFFAEEDGNMDEMMNRKLSSPSSVSDLSPRTVKIGDDKNEKARQNNKETPKKKNRNKKSKENKVEEKKPVKEVIVKRASTKNIPSEPEKTRKPSPTPLDDPMYAGGGYQKAPDPKQLSKPNLVSPLKKKEKKTSEPKESLKPRSIHDKFNVVHSSSAPHLLNMNMNMQPHSANSFHPVFYPGYAPNPNFYGNAIHENSIPSNRMMTLDEANQDLRALLNIK